MSGRMMLAVFVDIFRNLAYLFFVAGVVLFILACFKGTWSWVAYTFGAGLLLRILAAILRSKLHAMQ
jgi:hypothetical protein